MKRDEKHGAEQWVTGFVIAAVFPAAAVTLAVAYAVLRRRWSDRAVAGTVATVATGATVAAVTTTDYLPAWGRVVSDLMPDAVPLFDHVTASAADWATVAGVGATLGPALGSLLWLVTQRRRERDPFDGADERERRMRAEERRRRWVLRKAQAARHTGGPIAATIARPFSVGEGGPAGPVLGVKQRGDLGKPWVRGRCVALPMTHPDNRHLVILGATGLGKTETALAMAEWGAAHGWQVVYMTCKEPPEASKSAAPRLAAVAAEHGVRFRQLVAGSSPYDPMRGDASEVRDRLIRIEEWGDRYWAHVANTLVALALELNAEAGRAIDALPDLVYSLVRSRLVDLAKKSGDPRVRDLVEAFNSKDLGGALMRYASMAIHLRGWVGAPASGGWALEDADVACIELPTVSRPEAAAALMRLILRDFGSYLVDPARRLKTASGQSRPVLMVIEEAGAVAEDPVIGREFVSQVERNRSAGAYTVLTAQDPSGLGSPRTWSAISTNAAVLTYRQTEKAEEVATLAGTERVTEGGADYDTDGRFTRQGVARRQHTFKVHPQTLRELGQGEFVLMSAGCYAKVAAVLPKYGYGLPDRPEVESARRAVESSRLYLSAGTAHDDEDQEVTPAGTLDTTTRAPRLF